MSRDFGLHLVRRINARTLMLCSSGADVRHQQPHVPMTSVVTQLPGVVHTQDTSLLHHTRRHVFTTRHIQVSCLQEMSLLYYT